MVKEGTYWNLSNGRTVEISEEYGKLPGDEKARYLRVPAIAMLMLGPFIGLLFVILMPLLAILTVLSVIASRLFKGLAGLAGVGISFGWRPSSSYLSGKKKKKKEKGS